MTEASEVRVRYRIERSTWIKDDSGGDPCWDVIVLRDGEWAGACSYDTWADAMAAYQGQLARQFVVPAR